MHRLDRRHGLWLLAGLSLVALAVGFAHAWSYANAPQPVESTHRIAAGGFARTLLTSGRGSGVRPRAHRPHHLMFASNAGAVDVYVVACTLGYRAADWEHLNKLTDDFAAGRAPRDVVARASGVQGRIELSRWWERRRFTYVVLVRSAREAEVTLVTHYRP